MSGIEEIEEKRKSWKEEVERWRASGKSMSQWSREQGKGVNYTNQLSYWRNKFAPKAEEKNRAFIELPEESGDAGLAIECKNFTIQIRKGFDPVTLRKLLLVTC